MDKLHDFHCETVILSAMMHEPDEMFSGLLSLKFNKSSLYFSNHQKAYDLLWYIYNGGITSLLSQAFEECLRRKDYLDFFGPKELTLFLAEVWTADLWFSDIILWADMKFTERSYAAWAGLAAAAKVKHLESRRQAVYRAQELLRDSLSPTGDAEYIQGRIDELDELG